MKDCPYWHISFVAFHRKGKDARLYHKSALKLDYASGIGHDLCSCSLCVEFTRQSWRREMPLFVHTHCGNKLWMIRLRRWHSTFFSFADGVHKNWSYGSKHLWRPQWIGKGPSKKQNKALRLREFCRGPKIFKAVNVMYARTPSYTVQTSVGNMILSIHLCKGDYFVHMPEGRG